jgi:putative ABC transport system permease protein
MIKNYLVITLRSMKKNKAFIFINVFGMGIAIACTIVGYLAYQYDATFDAVHDKGQSIYRVSAVRSFENNLTHYGYVPLPLGSIAAHGLGDVTLSSRYTQSQSTSLTLIPNSSKCSPLILSPAIQKALRTTQACWSANLWP